MSTSVQQHRAQGPDQVRVAVITISDTRTKENDTSGKTIVEMLEASGQKVAAWEIVPDEPRAFALIEQFRARPHLAPGQWPGATDATPPSGIPHSPLPTPQSEAPAPLRSGLGNTPAPADHSETVDAILLTGGTGVGSRDQTFETISGLLTKTLPGFGEIFRMLSFSEVGAAAMLSRATGGLIGQTVVLAMPGSTNAVRLAMEKLIVPELRHLVREARR